MSAFLHRLKITLTAISAFLLCSIPFASRAEENPEQAQKPELHYLVADISGSIIQNKLEIPIKGAMMRYLGEVPENAEVRLRVFDHELSDHSVLGPPFDATQKGRAFDWINEKFKPARGNTLLFESAGTVMQEIFEDSQRFSFVRFIILTDGKDDPRDRSGREIATRFKGWEDVSRISRQVKLATEQENVAYLYTLNHEPDSIPEPDSGIVHTNVLDAGRDGIPMPAKPNAAFRVNPQQVRVGAPVVMFAVSDAGIETYLWTLSDGRESKEPKPEFTFDKAGSFTVSLRVSGPGGDASHPPAGESVVIEVMEDPPPPSPLAEFTANPRVAEVGAEILFVVANQTGIEKYSWDFGDGSQPATDAQPRHTYKKEGVYTVALNVSGPGGNDSKIKPGFIEIRNPPPLIPIVNMSAKPTKGHAPLTVQFKAEVAGEIARYHWDFGDGNTSDLRDPIHTYQKAGNYAVRLNAANTVGEASSNTEPLTIEVIPPREPLPVWVKAILWGLAAIIAWIIFVALILNRFLGLTPLRKPAAKLSPPGGVTPPLHRLAAKRKLTGIFWPVGSVTIGRGTKADIRVTGSGTGTVFAKIRRTAFSNGYELIPLIKDKVHRLEQVADLTTGKTKTETRPVNSPLRLPSKKLEIEIDGQAFEWTVG